MGKPKILFATCPEHGQANAHLALISSLKEHHGDALDIYLASYESFRSRVPAGVTFKPILGRGLPSYFLKAKEDGGVYATRGFSFLTTSLGFFSAIRSTLKMMEIMHPESPEEYIASAKSMEQLLDDLQPDLVVIDTLLDAGRDAVVKKKQAHILLSPNTLRDVAIADQEIKAFTYPLIHTGYPWPLPWYLFVPNMLAMLFIPLWLNLFDRNHKGKQTARKAAGYTGAMPIFGERTGPMLCMSRPAMEIPLKVPPDVICCGPMLQRALPLQEVDPELYAWLSRGPTILIVLGSHMRLDERDAARVLQACLRVLEARPDVQVLWKLQKLGKFELAGLDAAGDRVRAVDWLKPDPISILNTGQIACFINHGGSNSYHEALVTGTPQVINSFWYDCHEFGQKCEWIGVGRWANRHCAPLIDERALTDALLTVVGATPDAPEAARIRERAREIGELAVGRRDGAYDPGTHRIEVTGVVREGREGRDVAAEYVWNKLQEVAVKTK